MKIRLLMLCASLILTSCAKPDMLDSNGDGIFFAQLNEKWLIVNYWATWCAPCIAEIPELNELAEEHEGLVALLGVNFDNPTGEELRSQVKKMKIEFPVAATDPSALLGIDIPLVLPTTFLFKPGGQLVKTFVGPQTKADIMQVIDAALVEN